MRIATRVMASLGALALSAGFLAGCSSYKNTVGETADNLPSVEGTFSKDATIGKTEGKPPAKLQSVVIKEGSGKEVKPSSTVKVQYKLQLWDGTPVESSFDKGKPVEFPLSGVVPAWQKGLAGKKVGDRVLIVAPPDTAYGDMGAPPMIPPKATLIFVVDIIGVK